MITDGIKKTSDWLRKAIDAYDKNDPLHHTLDNIQAQQLLNNDLAILAIATAMAKASSRTKTDAAAKVGRFLVSPGAKYIRHFAASPTRGQYYGQGNTLHLGDNEFILNGRVIYTPAMSIPVPMAPSTGTRNDLVLLEMWLQSIDPVTGEGLYAPAAEIGDAVVYEGGWVGADTFAPFEDEFPDVTQEFLDVAEAGDIVRAQWQWRIRVVSSVDFNTYPKGVDDPKVAPGPTPYTLSDDGVSFTVDGMYALPLFRLQRNVSAPNLSESAIIDLRNPMELAGQTAHELSELIQFVDAMAAELDALNKAFNEHEHTDTHHTKDEVDAMVGELEESISNVASALSNHNHDDRYNTKAEINGMIEGVVSDLERAIADVASGLGSHNHDDRYDTKTEIGNIINGLENAIDDLEDKLDKHDHDDVYTKEEDVKNIVNSALPKGVIVMWSGSVGNIPQGWALCNGSNGTPDLRDRFIVGAGREYTVGATGGAKEVKLSVQEIPSHSHSGTTDSAGSHSHTGTTNSAGSHSHSVSLSFGGSMNMGMGGARGPSNDGPSTVASTNSSGDHSHSFTTQASGSHTHKFTTGSTGGNQAHENRPPYYALAYIMKL